MAGRGVQKEEHHLCSDKERDKGRAHQNSVRQIDNKAKAGLEEEVQPKGYAGAVCEEL